MIPELFLKELCETKPSGVMATVVSVDGHGPATPGDRLFWAAGKLTSGTVGGGSNEQQVLEACAKFSGEQLLLPVGSSFPATLPSCGGALQVLLEAIDFSDPAGESFWKTLQQLLPGPAPHIFLTLITDSDAQSCHLLANETGVVASFGRGCKGLEIPPTLLQQFMENEQSSLQEITCDSSSHSFFVQPLNRRGRLFLVGAGHVAREVAWLADRTGFQVTLIDPRRELMKAEYFPAGCSLYLMDAAQFFEDNTIGFRDYLVIAGPDHGSDLAALEQATSTPARYIGVMGSGKKIGSFEKVLRKKGLWQDLEGRLHAPIGIPIPSKIPAEVAVSIVAELIQVRNRPVIKQ
jgi:xanthine dehydrogenase accessory factor